jgi:predicted nucleotidyltransferase
MKTKSQIGKLDFNNGSILMPNYDTKRILSSLNRIETEKSLRILYACESGSRAWGFESKDSDFDVRFIYIRPPGWYLSIRKRRDVFEAPIEDDLDISGWDLTKALALYRKSNPPLLEWLQSPIIYMEKGTLRQRFLELMGEYYSPVSCMHHYLHMAQGNYREYLRGETVRLKKYFYVLRPVLACIWIEQGFGVVPMEFEILVDRLVTNPNLRKAIDRLLHMKRSGDELDEGNRIDEISSFLDQQISRLSEIRNAKNEAKDPNTLDAVFTQMLIETYGNVIDPLSQKFEMKQ